MNETTEIQIFMKSGERFAVATSLDTLTLEDLLDNVIKPLLYTMSFTPELITDLLSGKDE